MIINNNIVINKSGYIDKVEKGYSIKKNNIEYKYINEPVIVEKPKVENFNEMIIVHNSCEVYV